MLASYEKQLAQIAVRLGFVTKESLAPFMVASSGVSLSRRLVEQKKLTVEQRDEVYQAIRLSRLERDPHADHKGKDKKLAQLAIQQELLSKTEMTQGRTHYDDLLKGGGYKPLLEVLVESGRLDKSGARRLDILHAEEIYSCPWCGAQIARAAVQPGRDCSHCGAPFGAAEVGTVMAPTYDPDQTDEIPPEDVAAISDNQFIGQKLGYVQITGELGYGAMGVVYLGRHLGLDIDVAVKILPHSLSVNELTRQRFLREAQAAAKLSHPNVVRVMDVRKEGMTYFLVMEFVEGGSVQELLDREAPLEISEALRIAQESAAGVQAAHKAGLVHRDIKPANLLLTPQGQVKVADFGLARGDDSDLSTAGQLLGTPGFMPPEQVHGQTLDGRADIHALGITLYVMLTGELPYKANTAMATVMRSLNNPLPSPRESNATVPPDLDALVQAMCAKQADDRPNSMEEVSAMIRSLLAAEKQPAAPPAPARRPDTRSSSDRLVQPARTRRPSSSGPRRQGSGRQRSNKRKQNHTPLLVACGALVSTVVLVLIVLSQVGGDSEELQDTRASKKSKSEARPTPKRQPKKTPPAKKKVAKKPVEPKISPEEAEARYQALLATLQGTGDLVQQISLIEAYLAQSPSRAYRNKLETLAQSLRAQLRFDRSASRIKVLFNEGSLEQAEKLTAALQPGEDQTRKSRQQTWRERISKARQAPALVKQGMAHADKLEFSAAIAAYSKAIQLSPGLAIAYIKRGRAQLRLLNLTEARKDFLRAIARSPELAEAHVYLGVTLVRGDQFNSAVTRLTRGIELKPRSKIDRLQAYTHRAVAQNELGKITEALEDFERAMMTQPFSPLPYLHRGQMHLARKNWPGAISDYQRVVEVQPKDWQGWLGLGQALAGKGETKLALKNLAKAHKLAPASERPKLQQLIYAVKQGRD